MVEAVPDFIKMEEKLLHDWYAKGIVKRYLAKNSKSKQKFSFLDGPITANNPMGVHHARGRTYKDLWQRYKTMRGFRGRYQNGFYCQGLWVEVEVEKNLGFKSKKDIEKYGVEKFVNKCKERVKQYSAIQTEQSQRLGMWCDWDNSYFTMSEANNYAIWNFLKVCHERGWLYKGHDVVPWCPRCETAISQHEILTEDYREVTHQSVYLALPIISRPNEFLLVWTTTPWTLPANIAVAVDKDLTYCLVSDGSQKKYYLLQDLVPTVFQNAKILKTVKGRDLVGLKYTPPFADLAAVKQTPYHQVIATDKLLMPITTIEGTGLVHTATGAGAEDYSLGKKLGLPVIQAINDRAEYLDGFGELTGLNAQQHPEIILDRLGKFIFKVEACRHRYPVCWLCKAELVWKVTDEFYIAMDRPDLTDKDRRTLRQQVIQVAKQVHWIPEFGRERELDWLNNMHDWLISKKNRFWGLALPIYECLQCGQIAVIGSQEELKKKAISGWDKFSGHTPHKPWVDTVKIKCSRCGRTVSRIEPVGNPWLDAGIVPFSTLPPGWFPAEFITEAFPGQFKNWFYSMLVMSTVLAKTNPFQTVLGYESVVGEDGRAMHKSLGNAIEFNEGAAKIGVDVMRWMYAKVLPTAVLPFGYKAGLEIKRRFFLILWNCYRFYLNGLAKQSKIQVKTDLLDEWIISRLNNTIISVTKALDKYYSTPAAEALEKFLDDFSTWYIRRSRDRIEALPIMKQCLTVYCQLLAPFTPFISDYIYTNLTKEASVHLTNWPKASLQLIKLKLEEEMQLARSITEKIHAERKKQNLRVRQQLALAVIASNPLINKKIIKLIIDETNIKKIIFSGPGNGEVTLDTHLTPALIAEGKAREIIRSVQQARKAAGTKSSEPIKLELPDWPEEFTGEIKQKTLSRTIVKGKKLKVIRL